MTTYEFQAATPVLPPVDPDYVIECTLRGKIEDLKEYLYNYPEAVDLKDKRNGNVPIHLAASKGNLPLTNFLVSKGANLNIQDIFGNTALHYATDKSRKEMVLFLLNNGARINVQDFKGNSCLHIAARNDDFDMVKLLLLRNADPDLSDLANIRPFEKTKLLSIKNLIESKVSHNQRGMRLIDVELA